MTVILYTRSGCTLCEKAEAELIRMGSVYKRVDVSADHALQLEYGDWVPVITVNGIVVFEGGMSPQDLGDLLPDRIAPN